MGLTATSGIGELDEAVGGLYWGDNVVWEAEGASPEPFYRAIADTARDFRLALFVSLARDPDDVRAVYPGFDVVDARAHTALAQPDALLGEIRARCRADSRHLLLFDPLETMADRWGSETAMRFFARTCPLLLELGAIAYWSLVPSRHPQSVRREIEEITQCVVAVGDGRVRIAKAEGRPAGVQGTVFRYRVEDDLPRLTVAPSATRLGAALLALRVNRSLSQSDVARLAGVSPSAISQAERGQRGLSLHTLLELTAKLGITLDELLRGDVAPGYRLARRHDPRDRAEARALPLLDDPETGLRAYLVRVPPRASGSPPFAHKGLELVAVASGLVQVLLTTGRPVLREGEALVAECTGVTGWRNLSDREAAFFWILRDEIGPASRRPDAARS